MTELGKCATDGCYNQADERGGRCDNHRTMSLREVKIRDIYDRARLEHNLSVEWDTFLAQVREKHDSMGESTGPEIAARIIATEHLDESTSD